jgi:hypothetical protein
MACYVVIFQCIYAAIDQLRRRLLLRLAPP